MTNYESTSYHVKDEAGESVAFTVLPPSADEATAGTGEHDPVLKLWSTQVMSDNQLTTVEVSFSFADIRGLESFLADQFGSRAKNARGRESYESQVAKALGQFEPIPQPDMKPGDQVTVHVGKESSHYTVGDDGKTLAPNAELQGMWEQSDFSGGEADARFSTPPTVEGECRRTDPHHHMQDSTGIHWVHDGLELNCPLPDNHHPINVWHPLGLVESASRQCLAISNGVQCYATEGHQQFHDFGATQAPPSYTGDGAATPPATAPMATPGATGGEQADVSATGVGAPAAAPSSAPTEKKRTRRTKLEMAYDRAKEAQEERPGEQATNDALMEAEAALRAKDPGNERLSQAVTVNELPNGNVQVAYTPPAPEQQPVIQFAGEPVNPFTQPAQFTQAVAQLPGEHVSGDVYMSPEEAQASAAFPCPAVHSDGIRKCVRPYGHELQTANNPEPKPHAFATDPSTLQTPQPERTGPVAPFLPAPPMQPAAFSVSTPTLTGVTDGGAQILSFQTPPTPADPGVFQQPDVQQPAPLMPIQGAILQPPAPAAPFLQPNPNGGQ